MKSQHEEFIDKIIEIEWEMFANVKNLGGTASCQENPQAFKMMRKTSHITQSLNFLESYLNELQLAQKNKRNLMVEKYALMDNLISSRSQSKYLNLIVEAEENWMNNILEQFPHLIDKTRNINFKNYLYCELQTLSENTLQLYYENIQEALQNKKNLVKERYEYLIKQLGYNSLDEYEKKLSAC